MAISLDHTNTVHIGAIFQSMNICNEYFKYSLENTMSATDASKKFRTGMGQFIHPGTPSSQSSRSGTVTIYFNLPHYTLTEMV